MNFLSLMEIRREIKISKLKKGICFVVLVISLAGMMTTFVKVRGATTFSGYVKNNEDNPLSGASVTISDSYFNFLGSTTTNSQGYYSMSITLSGNSPYYLSAAKNPRYDPDIKTVTSGGTNNFELEANAGNAEKIAVFFWVTGVVTEDYIDDYIEILEYEGYTKFFKFEDSTNVASDCQTVDKYELDVDTVFVYVSGHGLNNGDHSYIDFKPGAGTYYVYSNTFRVYLNAWDAPRKCLLVDACYSGDWADDFAASPYLAMSSTNEDEEAKWYDLFEEPKFSHYFFAEVSNDGTAVEAFNFAKGYCTLQNPKIENNSNYEWFD